ncbi:ParA family protein [Tepidibacter formicigenes]|uniref:Chromosome partitioning protein n=1 Tax=Tepidibacter formicigenes DSM 15518 TaxID=1123349 RepID=A0A1M6U3V4_9FIRM|nr:ParA family protein [Tepidibacter formicigenes]SHK63849.1 chromosome partitioning protein [Tepidibacter formicigenes DSM 15518]
MKILSFATLKGGVGKTMSVFSVSSILAKEYNKKVLCIDVDPQGNLTNNFGIDAQKIATVKEIFENEDINFDDVVIKKPVEEIPNLDIIPSNIYLTGTEMRIINLTGREFLLRNYIKNNKNKFKEYDYILIDTNPSISVINQNAFIASDGIFLVNEVGFNSLSGSQLFITLWLQIAKRLGLENNIKGFLINRFDKRTKLAEEFLNHCKETKFIKDIIFDTVIPVNIKLSESELENKPINIFDTNSTGYKAYKNLTDELIERM